MTLTIVAVPGRLAAGSNGDEILNALGGNHSIAHVRDTDGELALNISVNPRRGCLIAAKNAKGKPCTLLVKVKRWSNGQQTTEIVASATEIYTFRHPADFIHLASQPVVTGVEVGPDTQNQTYGLLPPFFTKINSIAHLFKENQSNGTNSDKSNKIPGTQILNPVAHFDDATVPTEPLHAKALAPPDGVLMAALEKLFSQRPVWLRTAMDEHLPAAFSSWKKKAAFARTCYIFSDGPWRGCMCKLGYDPRKHPSSMIYQIIDFRDPYYRTISWKTDKQPSSRMEHVTESSSIAVDETYASAAARIPNFNPEVHFLAPPSRPSQLYQLCDIFDAGIQKLINDDNESTYREQLTTCSKTTGRNDIRRYHWMIQGGISSRLFVKYEI